MKCFFANLGGSLPETWVQLFHELRFWKRFFPKIEVPCAKRKLLFWNVFFANLGRSLCKTWFALLRKVFLQILEGLCASYSRQPLFPIRRKPLGNIVSILYGTMLFSYLDFVSHHHPTSDICGCIFYRKDELERAGWSFRDGYALHQFSLERGKIEQTFERKNTTGKFN